MPRVDLDTLVPVCTGGGVCDGKIVCETLAGADDVPPKADLPESDAVPSDVPPDSFWLSKDAEFDWFDRHAFYERKDSTRGGGAPSNPSPNSTTSQRFSANLKSKASMIGLPKPQPNHLAVDTKHRRTSTVTLFPKRTASLNEPSSPKVSCMGRVRSKKDRKGRSGERTTSRGRIGILSTIGSLFFSGCKQRRAVAVEESPAALGAAARKSSPEGHDIRERLPAEEAVTDGEGRPSSDGEPPALGAVNRFASGRRTESWGQYVTPSTNHVRRD